MCEKFGQLGPGSANLERNPPDLPRLRSMLTKFGHSPLVGPLLYFVYNLVLQFSLSALLFPLSVVLCPLVAPLLHFVLFLVLVFYNFVLRFSLSAVHSPLVALLLYFVLFLVVMFVVLIVVPKPLYDFLSEKSPYGYPQYILF